MITLKKIEAGSIAAFRDTRLHALRDTPTAFGSTFARESRLSEEDWQKRVGQWNNEDAIGLLAWDGETACGIIAGQARTGQPDLVHIYSMWVAPTHRRAGVGNRLVSAVLNWARNRGAQAIRLDVTSNNESAKAFYLRLGFKFTGKTAPYPNDPDLIELEMVLELSSNSVG